MTSIGLSRRHVEGRLKGATELDRSARRDRRNIPLQRENDRREGRGRKKEKAEGRADRITILIDPPHARRDSMALLKLHLRGERILSMQIDAMLSNPPLLRLSRLSWTTRQPAAAAAAAAATPRSV